MTGKPPRLTLKDVLLRLSEQQQAWDKLHSELTEQAKLQQDQTEHRTQEIEERLTQHQQEIKQLLQSMTTQSQPHQIVSQPRFFDKTLWGKTRWDWLNLVGVLLVPLMIGVFTIAITVQQNYISQQQHDTGLQITDKQNREAVLAAYQSSITDLLLNHKLGSMKLADQEEAQISAMSAHSLTLVTLHRLNANQSPTVNQSLAADQKGFLIQFLYSANLINQGHPVISLNTADLSGINLSRSKLEGINLSGANLTDANLSGTDLTQAYLWNAIVNTDLSNNTILINADLSGAKLEGSHLSSANLSDDSNLRGADFCYTMLHPNCNDIRPPHPSDLEDDVAQWSSYIGAQRVYNVAHVTAPSYDDNSGSAFDNTKGALDISLPGGNPPYTNVQAYRSVPLNNGDEGFHLSLSFYIIQPDRSEVHPAQAIEFTLSWGSGPPFQKAALQWQQIGDGTSQQGNPPNWRVGNGTDWSDLGLPQDLKAGQWYTFDLRGEIVGQQIRFTGFSCQRDFAPTKDELSKYSNVPSKSLGQSFAFSPEKDQPTMKDKVNIGMQLDGNAHEDPYDVYIDQVHFQQCSLGASCT